MAAPAILADLARVKALFQARAIAAAMGFPQPTKLPENPTPPHTTEVG